MLVEAKEAIDEVRANVAEVKGFWGSLKNWLGGDSSGDVGSAPAPQTPSKPKQAKKQFQEFDEAGTKQEIVKQLKAFFVSFEQLKALKAEQEEAIFNSTNEDKSRLMEQALDLVLVNDEMEQMAYDLRQLMVYQTKGMGPIYTKVVEMMGVISEQQALARERKMKAERQARWQRRRAKEKAVEVSLGLVGVLLVAAYLGGLWWILVKDRVVRWGF